MAENSELRDALIETVTAQQGKWFDVSYRLRAIDGAYDVDSLQVIPSTQQKGEK
jgi:hypothetical protein